MQTLINFWEYLDGKKTTIGAALLLLATFLSEVIAGKWHVQATWLQPTIETLNWVGMTITGLGIGHKIQKPKLNGG